MLAKEWAQSLGKTVKFWISDKLSGVRASIQRNSDAKKRGPQKTNWSGYPAAVPIGPTTGMSAESDETPHNHQRSSIREEAGGNSWRNWRADIWRLSSPLAGRRLKGRPQKTRTTAEPCQDNARSQASDPRRSTIISAISIAGPSHGGRRWPCPPRSDSLRSAPGRPDLRPESRPFAFAASPLRVSRITLFSKISPDGSPRMRMPAVPDFPAVVLDDDCPPGGCGGATSPSASSRKNTPLEPLRMTWLPRSRLSESLWPIEMPNRPFASRRLFSNTPWRTRQHRNRPSVPLRRARLFRKTGRCEPLPGWNPRSVLSSLTQSTTVTSLDCWKLIPSP